MAVTKHALSLVAGQGHVKRSRTIGQKSKLPGGDRRRAMFGLQQMHIPTLVEIALTWAENHELPEDQWPAPIHA